VNDKEKDWLVGLLKNHATVEALHALLKTKRDEDKELRLTGSFEELLGHVSKGHERGTFTDDDLFRLLARCEENGRQHIFYYVPADPDITKACADVDAIEKGLLKGKTAKQAGLPKTFLVPKDEVIADFRAEARPGTKYSRWVFKVYSGVERSRFLREEKVSETEFARYYERYYSREILLVVYHSFGLLEIRRSTFGGMSLTACRDELERVWKLLEGALDRNDFEPMTLTVALKALAKEAVAGTNSHDIHNAEFKDDKDGRWMFNPKKPDGTLVETKSRREAMKALRDECITAVVTWKKPQARPDLPEKLRTEICCFLPHEIRIGPQTTPEAVEYVSRRLHELS
jgi:hypothetical protein